MTELPNFHWVKTNYLVNFNVLTYHSFAVSFRMVAIFRSYIDINLTIYAPELEPKISKINFLKSLFDTEFSENLNL